MNDMRMDPVFAAALRDQLEREVHSRAAVRAEANGSVLVGLAVVGVIVVVVGVVLIGGGMSLLGSDRSHVADPARPAGDTSETLPPADADGVPAWSSPKPGGEKVTRLDDGVTDVVTGQATIDLGTPPEAATHLEVHLTCLSAGQLKWPDRSILTCGTTDTAGSPSFGLIPIDPDSTTYTFTAGPDDRWRFEIFYVLREVTNWRINENGDTYGVQNEHGSPDLVAVVATNGLTGYARREDLKQPQPKSPEEALEYERTLAPQIVIPVYKADGETVIGEFIIVDGDTSTSP